MNLDGGRRVKVAVVGGGCAGMTAAFELTRPEHQDRYEVTVYQLGFRLGGKGASSRGPAGRIEEHGLHIWLGHYENAFGLMRACYSELARDRRSCPIATWQDAFVPCSGGTMQKTSGGRWVPWIQHLPPQPGMPGDGVLHAEKWTVSDYLSRTVSLLGATLASLGGGKKEHAAERPIAGDRSPQGWVTTGLGEQIVSLIRLGTVAGFTNVFEALRLLELALKSSPFPQPDPTLELLDLVAGGIRHYLEQLADRDLELARLWEVSDVMLATVRGAIKHQLMTDPRGFDAVDEFDCREWLRMNGASERTLEGAFLRSLYDLVFAYEDGERPRISAATALRGAMRLFYCYRGAFYWKMTSGMGEIVFSPLYEVLKRRGVRFEFFHALANIRVSESGGTHASALEFDVQAQIKDGREYRPLVEVQGLPCWPSEPLYDQLVDGEELAARGSNFESPFDGPKRTTKRLEVERDFDFVVLAVGLGAVPHACHEIATGNARWSAMLERVKTVPTQHLQLWLNEDLKSLGWEHGPAGLAGFEKPFDTWKEMSHVLATEAWKQTPSALVYLCGAMQTPGGVASRKPVEWRAEVARRGVDFLNAHARHLWPGAVDTKGAFRWPLLVDPEEAEKGTPKGGDETRLQSQYYTANVLPSELYTLAVPGSARFRISPLATDFDNLTIAGDWTACGLNVGSVEAAVVSGRLAAHAISGKPEIETIVGFDHP